MKKLLRTFFSVVCTVLTVSVSFTACDEKKPAATDTGMTDAEWSEALSENNFINYTIFQAGRVITYENDELVKDVRQTLTLKFDVDGFSISGTELPEGSDKATSVKKVAFDAEAEDLKEYYTEALFYMLTDYSSFEYDAEKKVYTVIEEVSSTVVIDGDLCTLLLESGTVSFSSTGMLWMFVCNYTTTTESGVKTVYDMTWTFSAYDTTEIDEPDDGDGDSLPTLPSEGDFDLPN